MKQEYFLKGSIQTQSCSTITYLYESRASVAAVFLCSWRHPQSKLVDLSPSLLASPSSPLSSLSSRAPSLDYQGLCICLICIRPAIQTLFINILRMGIGDVSHSLNEATPTLQPQYSSLLVFVQVVHYQNMFFNSCTFDGGR